MNATGSGTGSGDGFVWPPRPMVDPKKAPSAIGPARRPGHLERKFNQMTRKGIEDSPGRAILRAAERHWLDRTESPLGERFVLEGWTPDRPGGYCPRCGVVTGPSEADELGCPACEGKRLAWSRVVRLGGYDGVLREAIHQAKYERWRVVGTALGELLGAAIRDELEAAGVDPAAAVLVPMPTTLRRRMVRGVDHALVLSRGVNRVVGGRIARPIRRAHRRSQVEIPMSERARNVARAFWPTEGWWLGDWTRGGTVRDLIVIDDVLTTGSTMRGACRAAQAAYRRRVGKGSQRPRVWAAVVGFAGGGGSEGSEEGGASEF